MKLDEFKKYRKIAESANLQEYPEAERIYKWMEESGRIDEGFWGAIWSWLKRNFSVTARRLHKLANEYEKELTAESRAEYGAMKDSKDLAVKFRKSWAGRVSDEIRDKMDIIASDDSDYRELVRTLINKKNLEVKTAMIKEFSGQMDEEDIDNVKSWLSKETSDAENAYSNAVRKLSKTKEGSFKTVSLALNKKINAKRKTYSDIGIKTTKEIEDFISMIIYYVNALSEKNDKIELNEKTANIIMNNYLNVVIELSKKVETSEISKEDAIDAVRHSLDKALKSNKPEEIDKLKSQVLKEASDSLSQKKGDDNDEDTEDDDEALKAVKPKVTNSNTSTIVKDDDVDTAIQTAAGDTGKQSPSKDEILKEIESSIKKFLSKNSKRYTTKLNDRITAFNNLKEDERIKLAEDKQYNLEADNTLKVVNEHTFQLLIKNFISMTGAIVIYSKLNNEDKIERSFRIILNNFLFEIYAVKKDINGDITSKDASVIIDNIKQKFPTEYA